MRTLARPIGLGLAARDDLEDVIEWARRARDSGRDWAHYGYVGLVLGAYMTLGLSVALGWLPPQTMVAILSLPFLARVIRSAELGATGQARAIAMIDLQTARLHVAFGGLLVVGILLSSLPR